MCDDVARGCTRRFISAIVAPLAHQTRPGFQRFTQPKAKLHDTSRAAYLHPPLCAGLPPSALSIPELASQPRTAHTRATDTTSVSSRSAAPTRPVEVCVVPAVTHVSTRCLPCATPAPKARCPAPHSHKTRAIHTHTPVPSPFSTPHPASPVRGPRHPPPPQQHERGAGPRRGQVVHARLGGSLMLRALTKQSGARCARSRRPLRE